MWTALAILPLALGQTAEPMTLADGPWLVCELPPISQPLPEQERVDAVEAERGAAPICTNPMEPGCALAQLPPAQSVEAPSSIHAVLRLLASSSPPLHFTGEIRFHFLDQLRDGFPPPILEPPRVSRSA